MFFAKPRLSAAVINCADCSASLMSGSGRSVTSAPTSRFVVRALYPARCLSIGLRFSMFRDRTRAHDYIANRDFCLIILIDIICLARN